MTLPLGFWISRPRRHVFFDAADSTERVRTHFYADWSFTSKRRMDDQVPGEPAELTARARNHIVRVGRVVFGARRHG